MEVNTLEDLDTVRNTLELLDQIRMQAQSPLELEADICKEIYYSTKYVKKHLEYQITRINKQMQTQNNEYF